MSKERTIIFIDGSNYYHILKNMFNDKKLMEFDFKCFIKKLIKSKKLIRVYYYTAPLDRKKDEKTYTKQQKFFAKLRKIPNFKLILCRMQKVKINGRIIYQVKEDDIHLAVDMVRLAYNNAYDTAILVSSDGDFVPAIQAVQEIGKEVENIGFENKFSYHLKQECDRFIKLRKEFLEECFN
ncbi:MAG: NYN domain-containing protein [Nanoarchaeota archaeon]|nr:NYN domain-containing protein [Nanoarchaeota archaeon]MBU4116811.1 NYN domain-containing protein [Nanoarchaeota archaeon]